MDKNRSRNFYYYLFDWANSPYSTIVITFVFSSYFTSTLADNKIVGTSLWGWTIALSGLFIAFLSPYLGYLGDNKKSFSKRFLIISTIIVVMSCFALWFAKKKYKYFLFSSCYYDFKHFFRNRAGFL